MITVHIVYLYNGERKVGPGSRKVPIIDLHWCVITVLLSALIRCLGVMRKHVRHIQRHPQNWTYSHRRPIIRQSIKCSGWACLLCPLETAVIATVARLFFRVFSAARYPVDSRCICVYNEMGTRLCRPFSVCINTPTTW